MSALRITGRAAWQQLPLRTNFYVVAHPIAWVWRHLNLFYLGGGPGPVGASRSLLLPFCFPTMWAGYLSFHQREPIPDVLNAVRAED